MHQLSRDEGETFDERSHTATAIDDRVVRGTPPNGTRACTRYRLGDRIGLGGMGEVFAAIDSQIGREVAVKRLRKQKPSERALARFFREACVQGRLDHPAIVPVHEIGVDAEGRPFFTMKKVNGTTLAKRIAEGHPRPSLLRAFADVCLAIQYAHEHGVVHRDLKPANIVLGDFGEVYVIDWGIAKILGERHDTQPEVETGFSETIDTGAGRAVGTPGYMAPEQLGAIEDIDGRADVYALGCLLFEILAGEPLHKRGTDAVISTMSGPDARPSLRAPARQIPPELDAICIAATALHRHQRIPSARELAVRVQRFLDGDRDVELRQTLAREHLSAARAAFDRLVDRGEGLDEEEQRRVAMRESARALALDPALDGAAELVGRLMLETPRAVPAEVARALADEDERGLNSQVKAGSRSYLFYIVLLPFIIGGGMAALPYHVALLAGGLITFLLRIHPRTRANPAAVLAGTACLLAMIAHAFSPLLVTPSLAVMSAMTLIVSPKFSPRTTALAMLMLFASVFLPWLAEGVGLLPQTISITADAIILSGPVMNLPVALKIPVLVILFAGVLGSGVTYAQSLRHNDRAVRERLHMQSWHLAQLVPKA